METEQFLQVFTGTAGIIVLIVIVLWFILSFFLPFMVYSIMQSNKHLLELNKKILAEIQGKGVVKKTKRVEPEI
jgi:cell division protein FtsL